MMEAVVNVVGMLVVAFCSVLLLTAYANTKRRLLLWSGLCFGGLACSNALLILDLEIYGANVDLYTWRLGVAAFSMLLLMYGLIFESE